MELFRTFQILRERFETVLAGLDKFQLGVCVLSKEGEVILRNEEARRVMGRKDGIALTRDNRILLADADSQILYEQALGGARDIALAEKLGQSSSFVVRRKFANGAYLLEVMPLRDEGRAFETSYRGVMVLIVDPQRTETISTAGMELLYGLTDAESEVCKLIAEGKTTREAADVRNAKPETVKSQIRSVLEKTSTNSRAQLVRLAHRVNPPISKDS